MQTTKQTLKWLLIATLVGVISVLHYSKIHGDMELHILHREMFFIPILLTSFWFGLRPGMATAAIVSLIYAPFMFYAHDSAHSTVPAVITQILVFIVIAFGFGWLVERQRKQQGEVLAAENLAVLGRAAIAIGHEMKDLLRGLKGIAQKAEDQGCNGLAENFEDEMSRLEQMVEILSSFVTTETVQVFSRDMNDVIREKLENCRKTASNIGVNLETSLDESGCPSRVDKNAIGWVLGEIIKNALEVSTKGQTIRLRSTRGGKYCTVQIEDEGPGIKPEHLSKLFKPFFTTKKMGAGLALAACRKILRDMGGDIEVSSELGHGATFTLTIPREYSGKPLAADHVATVISGEKVERIYRE
ncbi:MAG: ATP-binding protein [Syntrophobacterales bacterium]|jgi:signal transduction histidine kinase